MDAKRRGELLMQPRYMYKTCGHCGVRQLKAKHCRSCGQPIDKTDLTTDYRNDDELEAAVFAAANDGISKEARKSGLFCSSCGTGIAASEAHCPACGHQADESDEAVSMHKRNAAGEFAEVENDAPRFPRAAKAVASVSAMLPRSSSTNDSRSGDNAKLSLDNQIINFATSPVGIGIGVAVFLFVMWALFWPFTATATLINTQYKPKVEISYIEVKHDYCWLGIDCPSGYVELSRSEQDYTPSGEVVVSTRTVDESDYGEVQVDTITVTQIVESVSYGEPGPEYNCSENDEIIDDVLYPGVCTPVPQATYEYDSEDVSKAVYGTKTPYPHNYDVMGTKTPHPEIRIEYNLDVPRTRWHQFDWVVGTQVLIPSVPLDPNKREQLTGKTNVEYQVVYSFEEERHTESVNETEWYTYISFIGREIEVRVNVFGWLLGLK